VWCVHAAIVSSKHQLLKTIFLFVVFLQLAINVLFFDYDELMPQSSGLLKELRWN